MPRYQNQFIAQVKLVNAAAAEELTKAIRIFEQPTLLAGLQKTYKPFEEDGEPLPSEETRLRHKTPEILGDVSTALVKFLDTVATIDHGNTLAKGDVVVDGKTILKQVPATTLLFLEKRLDEYATFLRRVPVLDASEHWNYDKIQDRWASSPIETVRTVKIQDHRVVVPATDKHPAHVVSEAKDVRKGTYTTIKSSGAVPAKEKNEWLARLHTLQIAVKHARESANNLVVEQQSVGNALLSFILGEGIL